MFQLMSILQYFKPWDGLPNPRGPLCNSVASNAISIANRLQHNDPQCYGALSHTIALLQWPYVFVYMVASNIADSWQLLHFFNARPRARNGRVLCATIIQQLKKFVLKNFVAMLFLWKFLTQNIFTWNIFNTKISWFTVVQTCIDNWLQFAISHFSNFSHFQYFVCFFSINFTISSIL